MQITRLGTGPTFCPVPLRYNAGKFWGINPFRPRYILGTPDYWCCLLYCWCWRGRQLNYRRRQRMADNGDAYL